MVCNIDKVPSGTALEVFRVAVQIASNTDEGWLLNWSGEYEVIGDYWLPTWVEMTLAGFDGPDMLARVELRDHKPQLVRLEWFSSPYQRGIREADLRTMEIAGFVDVLYAGLAHQGEPRAAQNRGKKEVNEPGTPEYVAAQRFMQDLRRASGYNAITPEFLEAVAAVYRQHPRAPRAAVAAAFGVKPRMASVYVDRAREKGFLPKTTRGKKRA
jgi:hypothetical protein